MATIVQYLSLILVLNRDTIQWEAPDMPELAAYLNMRLKLVAMPAYKGDIRAQMIDALQNILPGATVVSEDVTNIPEGMVL